MPHRLSGEANRIAEVEPAPPLDVGGRRWERLLITLVAVVGVVASVATSQDLPCDEAVAAQCPVQCQEVVAALREGATPLPTTGQCVRENGSVGCLCRGDDPGTPIFVDDTSCGLTDRFGDCLLPPEAFLGCTLSAENGGPPETPDEDRDAVCTDVCATVDALRLEAAGPRDDVALVDSQCQSACICTIQVDEASCIEVFPLDGQPRPAPCPTGAR